MEKKHQGQGASYTYWVREATADAASLPLPKKLTHQDMLSGQSHTATLGSVWNRELLLSVGPLDFSSGKAEIDDVTKCVGDAFLVTVRNKKRVGYTYELTLKIKGEWHLRGERKSVKGHIDIPEVSFGELNDLQMEVKLSEEKDFLQQDKLQIIQDLKLFLQPFREKLFQFEQELKDK
ncbi:uncharacterized protein LOC111301790 isoform X2 [Durio zibethinus]|uniref:Uncharacterized protein LOC111301790 isoform X2 n=1 Tax=Durio zibethinus TaxID=66656 RepID=A0A6P5ZME0_DURZI|nr:uncharacterized protein LOC111301790 isoform X2 [Durio zibethinus]